MADTKITNSYSADDIKVLKGLEGVRMRPAMYIGSTSGTGLHHLVWEIVDNAVDEALSGYGNNITVTIHKDGSLSVLDEGRGIPVGINSQTGRSAIDLVFTELHAGGKFGGDGGYKVAGGLHGVGAAVTNALSEWLDVTVFSSGKINHIRYEKGGTLVVPLEQIGDTKKRGTLVRFKPDSTIFSTTEFKWDVISSHLNEGAYLMTGVQFTLIDERNNQKQVYKYDNGLIEYVGNINKNKSHLTPAVCFKGVDEETGITTEIAFQFCNQDYDENIYSYANHVRTRDGGTHETGFRTGFTKAINDFAESNNLTKGKKLEGSDIREGLTTVISMRVPEEDKNHKVLLEFEGQTKGKLGTPIVAPIVSNFIYNQMTYYLSENKELALSIIKKCVDAQTARLAARKAKEEARSSKKAKNDIILSDKLTPAISKDYLKNELFIVEGDSAGGSAKKGRDRMYQAILPLRGKPLNTDGLSIDKIIHNEEIATIINTIGAGFGQSFNIDDIHYGKIIIMTDADTDGAHIQTLLLTFFYHYMRQLITTGHVFIAVPPLYFVYKENPKTHRKEGKYAWTDAQLAEIRAEMGKDSKISRYKGLGEMDADQLKNTTMDPKNRLLVQVDINDPFLAEQRVSCLMGKDTQERKVWVEENIDFAEEDTFIEEVK